MITFRHKDLFSSGHSSIVPGPIQTRDAVVDTPGASGVSLIGQGVQAREIEQSGTLLADALQQLDQLGRDIEAELGGAPAVLADAATKDWPDCVMRRFEPGPTYRVGPRVALDYTITYLQTTR